MPRLNDRRIIVALENSNFSPEVTIFTNISRPLIRNQSVGCLESTDNRQTCHAHSGSVLGIDGLVKMVEIEYIIGRHYILKVLMLNYF